MYEKSDFPYSSIYHVHCQNTSFGYTSIVVMSRNSSLDMSSLIWAHLRLFASVSTEIRIERMTHA